MSDEVSTSHICTCCPEVIKCPGLPRSEGFMGHGTVTANTGKESDKLGWVGTNQTIGCPNLDTENSYFMVLPQKWCTHQHMMDISHFFPLSPSLSFLGIDTIICSWAEGLCAPSWSPVALVSSLSKLITTFLGTNTVLSSRGMLANTASVLSHYCLLNHTLFQMDSFVKGPPNLW